MIFLAPLALIGVLLLALPIAVHLFKPRKMKQTPFSSLRWLKQSQQRLSRRIQWHQWLLFLVRAVCILVLVLALAKPLVGPKDQERPTDRFIVIDTSRSMGYQTAGEDSPLQQAQELAGGLVQKARASDRTAVIAAGAQPPLLLAPGADASSALPAIKAIKPSLADTQVSAILPLVRSLLPREGERDVEVIFLTDNLKERWRQEDVQTFMRDLPGSERVKVIETGARSTHNAWIASARLFQVGEDRRIRVEIGCVGDDQPKRALHLNGVDGIKFDPQDITLNAGHVARAEFRIPAGLNLQGQIATLRLEPADALPSDDVFFLNLDTAWSLQVLLVEPEAAGADGRRVGLFLETALRALMASKKQMLEVATRTSATVTASDIQKADVVLLAGVPKLSDSALETLHARVRAGAGLAMFLGPQLEPDFYNQKFYRGHQPSEGLLPLTLKTDGPTFSVVGKPGMLTNIRWTHPLFEPLQDPVLSDFTQSRFRQYGNLSGALGKNDTVLACFDDDMPAILERSLGAGRVLLFNTSANTEWGDLPRQQSFLPLVDRMLSHLSALGVQRNFLVGAAVALSLADDQPRGAVTVVAPSGAALSPRLITQRGQTLLHLDEVAEIGVYRTEGLGAKDFAFIVNADRADSALVPMDVKALEAWWAPADFEIISAASAGQRLESSGREWPLWPALVALAGLLLVGETIYVHWLCPRADPKAADGVVAGRGVVKPVAEKSV